MLDNQTPAGYCITEEISENRMAKAEAHIQIKVKRVTRISC